MVTAKRRLRPYRCVDGPCFAAFKKLTRPARKGRVASTWEVNSERTHPLPLRPAHPAPLAPCAAHTSRAPTAAWATRPINLP